MKLNLSNQQINTLAEAITALDGRQENHLVEGKPVQVFRGHTLTHTARWNLARTLGRLHMAQADFERARSALITQHSEGAGTLSPAHPGFNAFAQDFQMLHRQEVGLDLEPITRADLRLEENEAAGAGISILVLNGLGPILA